MQLPKLSTNASVVAVVGIGAACAAYLANTPNTADDAFIAVIIAMAGGAVVQLLKQKDTDARVAAIDGKVDDNTETTNTTHAIVNSRMDEFKQALTDFAAQKVALAAQRSEIESLVAEARGMAAGREQVMSEGTQATVQIAQPGSEDIEMTAPVTIEVKAPEQGP